MNRGPDVRVHDGREVHTGGAVQRRPRHVKVVEAAAQLGAGKGNEHAGKRYQGKGKKHSGERYQGKGNKHSGQARARIANGEARENLT